MYIHLKSPIILFIVY